MNILYVEFYKYGRWEYESCRASAAYSDLYAQIESWGTASRRKMNLLAIF